MKPIKYELESGQLAMYLYRGNDDVACAFASTHGGWTVHINPGYMSWGSVDPETYVVDTRDEAVKQLEKLFPGLVEV